MRAVLWGKDHIDLGHVAVAAPAPRVGLALSRGLHRKAYRYTDPNEDVVAAVVGRHATLLAVADGHNGLPSSEAAVNAVLEWVGDDPPADLTDEQLDELIWAAHSAVLEVTQAHDAPAPESRTTLVVGLLAGSRLRWISFGDSAVYIASPAAAARLDRPRQRFIGYRDMPRRAIPMVSDRGWSQVGADQWVVLGTDGLSDFARPFPTALFTPDADPVAVARAVVEAAFDGGAGDNVAVVVARPRPTD